MSKELYFTDGNNEVKYLDTTASFNLAITQDGSAFDLTNATAIDVKVANDTGYVFDKSIDMTTIKQPLAGLITMPVDAEVMNALVPDDYTIEVWVTLSSLITPGSQEGLTDTGTTTSTTGTTTSSTDTTTYNAIFPSDDPQGFTITENVMSDSGDVIPVMSLDDFQQEFDQLKTDLTNKVSTLQGPKGDTGQGLEIKGKVDTTSQLPTTATEGDGYLVNEELYVWTNGAWKDCGSLQGPQGVQGKTGTGVSSTTIQYQISNSATTTPTGTWYTNIQATTTANPYLWMRAILSYDDGTSKPFYLISSKGDKGDKGDTGDKGDKGDKGDTGPVGAGLVVKGTVSNASQLPTTGNQEGYCYFVGTDLYVFDAGAWKNCGSVSPNLSNYVTVADLNNGLSTKVTDNKNNTITANGASYDLSKSGLTPLQTVSSGSFNDLPLGTVFVDSTTVTDGPDTIHAFTTTTFYSSMWNGRKAQIAIDDNSNSMFFRTLKVIWKSWTKLADDSTVVHTSDMRKPANDVAGIEEVNAKQDKIGYTPADDSKVAHLSGANNFDTVPTVNNNPLLLASSLPSTLADTTKLSNFTAGLQSNGTAVATKSDVTTAISTATANMVDSSKPTNFTAGLQSGGVNVATAADLKSVEASAWRVLDNKYITPASGNALAPSTSILYKIDDSAHKLYLSGAITLTNSNSNVSVTVQLGSIIKSIKTLSVPYLGYTSATNNYWNFCYAGQSSTNLTFLLVYGIASISATTGTEGYLAFVTYDKLV